MCAACPTPRLNQSYELRPPWEQHLRYVPHRVHNGHNSSVALSVVSNSGISITVLLPEVMAGSGKYRGGVASNGMILCMGEFEVHSRIGHEGPEGE